VALITIKQQHNFGVEIGTVGLDRCKSNYHTIMTTTVSMPNKKRNGIFEIDSHLIFITRYITNNK